MTIALDGLIEVDDRGVARIAGTRMKVTSLVLDKLANHSTPEEMAKEFPPLTLAQIHSALAYYYSHQAELDAQIQEDQRVAEQMRADASRDPRREDLLKRRAAERAGPGKTP